MPKLFQELKFYFHYRKEIRNLLKILAKNNIDLQSIASYTFYKEDITNKNMTFLSIQNRIESEMLNYLKQYPFHNIFRLYLTRNISAPQFGGTCSDRTVHFQKKMNNFFIQNSVDFKLHIASINGKRTHTILRLTIEGKVYFCDIGMGYPITKLLPSYKDITFTSYGIEFKSIIKDNKMTVLINENKGDGEKELMIIEIEEQSQEEVKNRIKNRIEDTKDLPMAKKLRYFFIHNEQFIQIKE